MRFYACLAIFGLALVYQGAWAQPSSDQAPAATGVAAFESSASVPAAPVDSSIVQANDSAQSTEATLPNDVIAREQGIEGVKSLLKKYWLALVALLLALSWWIQGRLLKRSE